MTLLPRVTELTRERLARELDNIGPTAIAAEAAILLGEENPELLDMARRCAGDSGDATRVMVGFGAFYRLLTLEARTAASHPAFAALPRVSAESRNLLVHQIDAKGAERFTTDTLEHMQTHNPELLQMAHSFAARLEAYIVVMQGFCLIYEALIIQSVADRRRLH
ncbi:MAG TPA: hypothetical protein VL418_06490 [Devosiaceae bacterium]|nr:hypothetical protein [Devosiaceae bacterium]